MSYAFGSFECPGEGLSVGCTSTRGLVAGTMGNIRQESQKEMHLCMVILNNQKPGKCVKADCLSTCKKQTQGKHPMMTSCMATKCLCFVRCPSS
ncbi:hypothetical protein YC2023_116827 [Brassica napus]